MSEIAMATPLILLMVFVIIGFIYHRSRKKRKLKPVNIIRWLMIPEEEVRYQVEEYSTLRMTSSARGEAAAWFLFFLFFALITLLGSYGSDDYSIKIMGIDRANPYAVAIYYAVYTLMLLVLAYYLCRGSIAAILIAMLYWTLAAVDAWMGEQLPKAAILVFWVAFMRGLFLAYKVERARKQFKTT